MRLVFLFLVACADATHEECVQLPTSECETTAGCTWVRARPLTPVGSDFCLRQDALAENVGCRGADLGCDDVITVADDPDGGRWWFWDSCIPDDFVATKLSDAEPCF